MGRIEARLEEIVGYRLLIGASKESQLVRKCRSVFVSVRLNQPFDSFDNAMHISGHRSRCRLRTAKSAPRICNVIGVFGRLLNILSFNARRGERVMMAGGAGEELGRKALLFVDKGLLILIIHKDYRDSLRSQSSISK